MDSEAIPRHRPITCRNISKNSRWLTGSIAAFSCCRKINWAISARRHKWELNAFFLEPGSSNNARRNIQYCMSVSTNLTQAQLKKELQFFICCKNIFLEVYLAHTEFLGRLSIWKADDEGCFKLSCRAVLPLCGRVQSPTELFLLSGYVSLCVRRSSVLSYVSLFFYLGLCSPFVGSKGQCWHVVMCMVCEAKAAVLA